MDDYNEFLNSIENPEEFSKHMDNFLNSFNGFMNTVNEMMDKYTAIQTLIDKMFNTCSIISLDCQVIEVLGGMYFIRFHNGIKDKILAKQLSHLFNDGDCITGNVSEIGNVIVAITDTIFANMDRILKENKKGTE